MIARRKEKNVWWLWLVAGVVGGLIIALAVFWYNFKDMFQ